MKATGITKQIDPLGRLLIPKTIRKALNVEENDTIEFFLKNDNEVILKKYEIACTFCGAKEDLLTFEDRKLCTACIEKLKNIQYLRIVIL